MDLMMTEELSLPVPSETGSMDALKDGLTMFLAFTAFGMLPIVGFVVAGFLYPGMSTERSAESLEGRDPSPISLLHPLLTCGHSLLSNHAQDVCRRVLRHGHLPAVSWGLQSPLP